MPNTRHAHTADPAHAPERHLSSARLRPINVSLAIASNAARIYDPETRAAVLWLANVAANSQRIQFCWQDRQLPDPLGTVGRITEVELSRRLGLEPIEIYEALTGGDEADLPKFREAVKRFRAEFEAALPPVVKTQDTRTIQAAFDSAALEHRIAVLSGKWRHGKTVECERVWLKNLHRAVWVHCPSSADKRGFVFALARALGIGTGGGIKPSQLEERIRKALAIGLIDTVFIDEAHNLWPADLRDAKPVRAEFVRELRDELGVGFVLITTDQFALSLELARVNNTRWAPGQFFGRQRPFQLRDVHTDKELAAIARLHTGPCEEAALAGLVAFAKADEGYLGAMVNAATRARREADDTDPGRELTAEEVAAATRKQQTAERIKIAAAAAVPKRRGRFEVVSGRRAA